MARNNFLQSLCAMGCLTHHTWQGIMSNVTRPVAERNCTMSGTMSSATSTIHELRAAVAYCFPLEAQERLALLQTKNNEGTLTEAEAAELQALVKEYNAHTLEKAKALLELQRRGTDTGNNPRS
jgi:hypothetical protein